MRFVRRSLDREPSVNLTPLIDIVFLLLIFFMVSSRFVNEQELPLELPSAAHASAAAPEDTVTVTVNADGGYRLDGQRYTAADLEAGLVSLRQRYPTRALRVRADGQARHAAVVRVLDGAAAAGFARVDIAARRAD